MASTHARVYVNHQRSTIIYKMAAFVWQWYDWTGKGCMKRELRELCTEWTSNTTVRKVCSRGTVKIGEMYYSASWCIYKPIYSARSGLTIASTAAEFAI